MADMTPELVIRPLDLDDPAQLRAWANLDARVFQQDRPDDAEVERRRELMAGERIEVVDEVGGAGLVAAFESFDTRVSVPGGALIDANAISGVVVSPTHKRRGLLTRLMASNLDRAAQAGAAVSLLFASQAPIYGRFGFGTVNLMGGWDLHVPDVEFKRPATGSLRAVEADEALRVAQTIFQRAQRRCVGSIDRSDYIWQAMIGRAGFSVDKAKGLWFVAHYGPDVDGLVSYWLKEDWTGGIPAGTLVIRDLIAATDEAEQALWQHCAQVDLVATVRCEGDAPSLPLPHWLVDPRAARSGWMSDGLWARVLDVPALLSARSYPIEDRVLIEVNDPAGLTSGCYLLQVGLDGRAQCTSVTLTAGESPDLTIEVASLATLAFGSQPGTESLTVMCANGTAHARAADIGRLSALFSSTDLCRPLTHF